MNISPTAQKFRDPGIAAKGEMGAPVAFGGEKTLWVNAGTLCHITCGSCHIEGSPENDRLAFLKLSDVEAAPDTCWQRPTPALSDVLMRHLPARLLPRGAVFPAGCPLCSIGYCEAG